jgi:hypothetical protein
MSQEIGTPAQPSPPFIGGPLLYAAFGLVAFTILAAQVVLSRLFSGTMTYYYAFMLVSLAMLGLAAGGLIVQMAPRFFTPERAAKQAAIISLLMGIFCFSGTLAYLEIYPQLAQTMGENYLSADDKNDSFWLLGGVFWCLFPFFLAGGTVVSLVLCHVRQSFHRAYAVDLASAALGCVAALLLLSVNTPVELLLQVLTVTSFLAAAIFALARKYLGLASVGVVFAVAAIMIGPIVAKHRDRSAAQHSLARAQGRA